MNLNKNLIVNGSKLILSIFIIIFIYPTQASASSTYNYAGSEFTSTTTSSGLTNLKMSFTLAEGLAPNSSYTISTANVLSFTVNDGIFTFTSSPLNTFLTVFNVHTDNKGMISTWDIKGVSQGPWTNNVPIEFESSHGVGNSNFDVATCYADGGNECGGETMSNSPSFWTISIPFNINQFVNLPRINVPLPKF